MTKRTCSIQDCERQVKACGLCNGHWKRSRRYGTPLGGGTLRGKPLAFLEAACLYQGDECLIWPFSRAHGYAQINIGGRARKVHQIVCEKVHGSRPSLQHGVAHSCGRGQDGCIAPNHLRWATQKENAEDAIRHGVVPHGERHPHSKLTAKQALEIRRRALTGENQRRLADEFGVCNQTVNNIKFGRIWTSLGSLPE